jgi:hypothetical protein
VRFYAAKVDVYVDEPAEPICVETPPIDRVRKRDRHRRKRVAALFRSRR